MVIPCLLDVSYLIYYTVKIGILYIYIFNYLNTALLIELCFHSTAVTLINDNKYVVWQKLLSVYSVFHQ